MEMLRLMETVRTAPAEALSAESLTGPRTGVRVIRMIVAREGGCP